MENLVINYCLHEFCCTPTINDNGDWIDLHSAEDVEIYPPKFNVHTNEIEFQTGMISLGISMKIPEGYEAHILPRSSTFKNFGIVLSNSQGIIDGSYSGTNDIWKLPYIGYKKASIKKGDRICQFRIIPSQKYNCNLNLIQVKELDEIDRGGFGSTGI